MIIFFQVGLCKARLGIIVGECRIAELRALASPDSWMDRSGLDTLLALKTQRCWDRGNVNRLSGQMYQDPKGGREARPCVGNIAGVVCNQRAEPTRIEGLEVVVQTVVGRFAECWDC